MTRVGLAMSAEMMAFDWPDTALLVAAAAARGISAEPVRWDDPAADWSSYDTVLLFAPWDYTSKLETFLGWLPEVASASTLPNPTGLVAWNVDKRYLLDLGAQGIEIPQTLSAPSATAITVARVADEFGEQAVVVKPAVDAGGRRAHLCRTPAAAAAAARELGEAAVLVQAYEPAIETAGELSVLYFGGRLSHVIRKTPAAGEFRIHQRYGGAEQRVEPEDWVDAFGRQVLAALHDAPAYARIDLVPRGSGGAVLMEVELIEPDLFFRHAPEQVDAYLDAVTGR